MDPNQILPDDLKSLDDEALTKLIEDISAEGEDLIENGDDTDETTSRIESLAEARDLAEGEVDRRNGEREERAAKRQNAAAKFRREAPEVVDEEPEDETVEGEGDEGADVVEITADTDEGDETDETDEGDEGGQPAAQPMAASTRRGTPRQLDAGGLRSGAAATRRGTPAPARTRPRTPAPRSAAQLGHMQPKRQRAARTEENVRTATTVKATGFGHSQAGTSFGTTLDLAREVTRARHEMGHVDAGVTQRLKLASGLKAGFAAEITADPFASYAALRYAGEQREAEALVASGGSCAPLSPLYEFFRTQVAQAPIESALPVVQAPRGGIRYIVSPPYSQPASGIGVLCSDGTKPVVHVPCPTVTDENVCAVTQIIEFDNLQYRVFPEQVDDFLAMAAIVYAETKERHYLTEVDTGSTPVTASESYGAARNLLWDWVTASVGYRKRAGMPRGAQIEVWAPDWSLDMIKLDMAMEGQQGLNFWDISDGQVQTILRQHGLEVTWYADRATSQADQKFNAVQGINALNRWPGKVASYLFAPGTWVRLDSGNLDLGIVRDSILNGTNNLQLFYEEWLGMAKMGVESVRLISSAFPSGTYPNGVTPMTS